MSNLIKKVFSKKPGSPRGGWYYVFQCLYCQKPFVSPGYEVNAGKMTKYCSNECQMFCDKRKNHSKIAINKIDKFGNKNANYKDGRSYYNRYRKNNCEVCGITSEEHFRKGKVRPLLVHHCDANRNNSREDNLKTLCYSCHMRIHNPSYYGKYPEFQKW